MISIDKNHNVLINQEASTWDKLQDRLMEIFKTRADRVVFIKGDPDIDFLVRRARHRYVSRREHRQGRLNDAQGGGR